MQQQLFSKTKCLVDCFFLVLAILFVHCIFPFQNSMGNTFSVPLMLSKSPRSKLEVAASLYPRLPVLVIREVLFYHQNSMNNTSSVPLMLSKSTRSKLEVAALPPITRPPDP
jgi:hypothetical protein